VPCKVVGRIHGRQEWEGALLRVPVALVVDVVEHETVQIQPVETFQGDIRDLLSIFRGDIRPGRRRCEE
jgi:hypothetical protein